MKALRLTGRETLSLEEFPEPVADSPGTARVRIKFLALNHLDCFAYRGMAFARRKLPITVGAEAMGVVDQLAPGVPQDLLGAAVAIYPGLVCGTCQACREGRENLCEHPEGILGFHMDGVACSHVVVHHRQLIEIPAGVDPADAACASITFGTVEHMLFDNAELREGQTVLVHAAGSGIGSTAVRLAKAVGASVIATIGSDDKRSRCQEIGADHVINYREDRFERQVRKLTGKRGVDVVFEHVGSHTWPGSLLCLRKGGHLVTCGSTTGVSAETNLMLLFNQQLRITGSFGGSFRNVRDGLMKMTKEETRPVIDDVIALGQIEGALQRMRSRRVFGKIIVDMTASTGAP